MEKIKKEYCKLNLSTIFILNKYTSKAFKQLNNIEKLVTHSLWKSELSAYENSRLSLIEDRIADAKNALVDIDALAANLKSLFYEEGFITGEAPKEVE